MRGGAGLSLGTARPLASAVKVWMASNKGASQMIQGYDGTGGTRGSRRPMKLPVPFRRARIAVPVTTPNPGTLADQFLPNDMKFAFALHPTFTDGAAGLPVPSVLPRFGGQRAAIYTAAGWDQNQMLIVSDIFDMGQVIPAGQEFTLIAAMQSAVNCPQTHTVQGQILQRWHKFSSASDLIATDEIAARTAYQSFLTGLGETTWVDNSYLIVETDEGAGSTILSLGDSQLYGRPYDMGDDYGETGIIGRGLARRAFMHCNFGRGGDGDFNLADPTKWALRRKTMAALHAIAPFKQILHENGSNDATKTFNPAGKIDNVQTRYGTIASVAVGGGVPAALYMCVKEGVSGTAVLTHQAGDVADGGVIWRYWGPNGAIALQREAIASGNTANVLRLLRSEVANIPIWGWKILCRATSANGFIAPNDQVVAAGWGDATSLRGRMNARKVLNPSVFGFAGIIDATPLLEQAPDTSMWILGQEPNELMSDEVHPKDKGAIRGAPALDVLPLL